MSESLELPEFIDYLVEQLLIARDRAKTRTSHVLRLNECELEIAMTAKKEGKGGIKAWVVELGGSVAAEQVHRIKVKLSPINPADEVYETEEARTTSRPRYSGAKKK
jgi:hypothetical protein